MYCVNCDHKKKLTPKSIVYKYDESGLDNIVLDGVIEYRCPNCGEVYRSFGNVVQLHGLIADALLTKEEPLTGAEVRFLRTHIGYSGAYFSQVLDIDPTTLSRIENDKQSAGGSLDKHIRQAVFNKEPDRDYDLHEAMLAKPTKAAGRISFALDKKNWRPTFAISPLVCG